MTSNRMFGRKILLGMALTLAVSNVAVFPSDAFGADKPKLDASQIKLACKTFFTKSLPRNIWQLGKDMTYWVRGYRSELAYMKETFRQSPDLWKALDVTRGRRYYDFDNQLRIYNTEEDMASVAKKTLGFCWGHATMKFYFTRLTFFDPQFAHVAPHGYKEGSRAWVEYYRKIITKIANGEPAVVPGFANLREFSSHPKLIDWFRHHSAIEWAEHMTANIAASAKMFLSKRDFTTAEGLKFVQDLQERLAQGYNPKIVFDENSHKLVEGEQNSLHVVQVMGVHQLENDRWAIEVVDDKFGIEKKAGAGNANVADNKDHVEVLYLNLKGTKSKNKTIGVYLPWRFKDMDKGWEQGNMWDVGGGHVNQVRLAPENDREAMQMALSLADFCHRNPRVCKELGAWDEVVRERPALQNAGGSYRPVAYSESEEAYQARMAKRRKDVEEFNARIKRQLEE